MYILGSESANSLSCISFRAAHMIYVTLDNKTSHKGQFFEIEMNT